MTATTIINNLAGLLMLTSLLVVLSKKIKTAAILYAIQSGVLVLLFIAIGHHMNSPQLYTWATTAIFTKVILVPLITYYGLRKLDDPTATGMIVSPQVVIGAVAVIILLSYFFIDSVHIPYLDKFGVKPVFAVALGHFMVGVLCIVTQRSITKQIFGYCIMENGAHVALALLAHDASHIVEIGITTDAVFAVVVMVYMVRRIYASMKTLNAQDLTSLKG